MNKTEQPNYSIGEELINSISHGIGVLFGIAALVLSIVYSNEPIKIISVSLYGITLIILYSVSCLYHSFPPINKAKKIFRILDHDCIYLLILGTNIPYLLISVGGIKGWILFGILFFLTIIGIILNSINLEKYKNISLISYILMGWIIILSFKNLHLTIGYEGLLLLILGGILYTIGIIFYKLGKKIKYMHSVFHLFVLAGSILHFFSIFLYVVR